MIPGWHYLDNTATSPPLGSAAFLDVAGVDDGPTEGERVNKRTFITRLASLPLIGLARSIGGPIQRETTDLAPAITAETEGPFDVASVANLEIRSTQGIYDGERVLERDTLDALTRNGYQMIHGQDSIGSNEINRIYTFLQRPVPVTLERFVVEVGQTVDGFIGIWESQFGEPWRFVGGLQ